MQFEINDMTCGRCVARVTAAVQAIDAAATVAANVGTHQVDIQSTASQQTLMDALEKAGYPARALP